MRMIILGIDPGTLITGYGLIKQGASKVEAIDFGCIRPPATMPLAERYLVIYNGIILLIEQHKPDALAIESQFVLKNVQSAIKLGMAKGMAILAAAKHGIPIFEYPPTKAKRAVVGQGHASKWQVQKMIQTILHLPKLPEPEDAADALSLAICHAQTKEFTCTNRFGEYSKIRRRLKPSSNAAASATASRSL